MTKITYNPSQDYYRILRVRPQARPEEIRAAYLAAMRLAHPDLNPARGDATAATQTLNTAYEVLSQPVPRAEYDRLRREYFRSRVATAVRRKRRSRAPTTERGDSQRWVNEILARIAQGVFNGLTSR